MKKLMRKIWLKILIILKFRCPKCGNKISNYGYGDYCLNNNCNWIEQ